MDWNAIKQQGCMMVDGEGYDLSHLQDAKYHFTIEASGKYQELQAALLVQYSSHCVSWGSSRGGAIDFAKHGEDRRIIDDKGVHRCLCDDRYTLSSRLPEIFETFLERKCLFTGHENWMTVEIIDQNGQRREYEVFFNITKQSKGLLRAYVESAYVRDPLHPGNRPSSRKRRDKMKASTLLAKKLRGEPIRRPPR